MTKSLKLAVIGAIAGVGIYFAMRAKVAPAVQSYLTDISDSITDNVQAVANNITGGFFLRVGNMRTVRAADLNNANVQAFLKVIRTGEGTTDTNGYRRIFGGQLFSSFADHPRVTVKKSGYTSSAAGAYQFIASTWDETKRIMGLTDFSPSSQDLAALGRIVARGALDDVKNGNFELAVKKCAREWASLPFSPYGQPTITIAKATSTYINSGGTINEGFTV